MLGFNKKKDNSTVPSAEQNVMSGPQAPVAEQQVVQNVQATPEATTQAVAANQQAPQDQQATQQTQGQTASNNAVPSESQERERKPLIPYRYTIINGVGKKEQGSFDAESENDVRNFLLSQEYQVLEIKERSKFDIDIGSGKISANDLAFSLTQLSTYIKAGIPLADSVRILAKQAGKPHLKKSFNQLVYQLLKGESLSDAMLLQESVYPRLLINMVKTAEMTGDLPSILDDMAEYYTSMEQTRKQMKSAMTYPVVVLTLAFGVLIFMLTYLVPQFTAMFESNGAQLPALTLMIVKTSEFIRAKWYILIAVTLVVVITFVQSYKKIQKFRVYSNYFNAYTSSKRYYNL